MKFNILAGTIITKRFVTKGFITYLVYRQLLLASQWLHLSHKNINITMTGRGIKFERKDGMRIIVDGAWRMEVGEKRKRDDLKIRRGEGDGE